MNDIERQLYKTEALGRMAEAIAHLLNNQLHVVMMNLELAARKAGPEAAKNLADAMKAVRQAAEVGSSMLAYLGRTQKRETLDLSDFCLQSQIALVSQGLLTPKNLALVTDLSAPGARTTVVSANANQMQQVLTSLVTNAVEATEEGSDGAIRLAVRTVLAEEISTAHRFPVDFRPSATAYACLEVADTGCGIADQDMEKIFDPFFSSKFLGRGMGLAVVLGIVRSHGGVVTVVSEPGRGSIFSVFLPIALAESR